MSPGRFLQLKLRNTASRNFPLFLQPLFQPLNLTAMGLLQVDLSSQRLRQQIFEWRWQLNPLPSRQKLYRYVFTVCDAIRSAHRRGCEGLRLWSCCCWAGRRRWEVGCCLNDLYSAFPRMWYTRSWIVHFISMIHCKPGHSQCQSFHSNQRSILQHHNPLIHVSMLANTIAHSVWMIQYPVSSHPSKIDRSLPQNFSTNGILLHVA